MGNSSKESITDAVGNGKRRITRLFSDGGSDGSPRTGGEQSPDGLSTSRRSVLRLLGASVGAAAVGTQVASASTGPQHLQVPRPEDLCGTRPGDHHLALIEDLSALRGRGFYTGTSDSTWAFTGWLQQTEPTTVARGSVTPDSDASEPSRRLLQVRRPADLKSYKPTDQQFAFIEDASHEHGRGFYTGSAKRKWYFVGWLAQSEPSSAAGGKVEMKQTASEPGNRMIQVRTPNRLRKHDPTDYHLAFIEDASHEHGRGFYAGGADGNWYFVGWLAQSPPSGTASDTVDPQGPECGAGRGAGDETGDGTDEEADDGTDEETGTDTLSNGAWQWYADRIDGYESEFGDEVTVAATGHGKNRWANFVTFDTRDFPEWIDGGDGRLFLPHIPMLPREENDAVGRATALRNLAAGEYNDKFRSMAEGFKSDGFTPETLVLRIGNEFNIEAQPYSPVGTGVTPETWAEGYRQIVDTCRDVLGEDLRTVWAPLVHSTQLSTEQALAHYPGADYAMVGADIYDSAPAYGRVGQAPDGIDYDSAGPADRATVQEYVWEETHLKGNKWGADGVGLSDVASLAAEVDRPVVVPEWGLSHDGYEWGGDANPTFVRNMYEWMTEHDVPFHAYFEHDTSGVNHELFGDNEFDFAAATTEYRATFGGQSVSPPEDDDSEPVTSTNYVFVTDSELETQKERAEAGREPWASAYDNLISDAESALGGSLSSVTDDDGDHSLASENGRHDYRAAIEMSERARDCALAYRFTGKERFAERAVEVIHHWCLNDGTYMTPTVDIEKNAVTIEQHITIPGFIYAAALVRGHSAWDDYDGTCPWKGADAGDAEAAFAQWVRDRHDTFVPSQPSYCEFNNKWAWRITDRAASAAYLQDVKKMERAKCMWRAECLTCDDGKPRPWSDFVNNYKNSRSYSGSSDPNENALFKQELSRSTAFIYTAFNLKALTMPLLVFERYDGTSLYGFNAPTDNKDGSSLWKAYNWFEDYVQDTSAWKWNSGNLNARSVEEATSAFEHAYAHWGDFAGAINNPDKTGSRPHYDSQLLGHVTLTHGQD